MELHSFSELIGHDDVVRHLKAAIKSGQTAHAYIFAGEKGSGKMSAASLTAATLLCKEQGDDPCGNCISCSKAFSNNHPDIIYVQHEKPNVITVDEIRDQVVATADIKPYESPYKIYIIADADKMNVQAQNALLKTIEEPAPYVVVILLAVSKESLLETIQSRCITLTMRPVPKELVKDYLIGKMHVSAQEAEVMAAFSQGNIGKARSLALGGDFSEMVGSRLNKTVIRSGALYTVAGLHGVIGHNNRIHELTIQCINRIHRGDRQQWTAYSQPRRERRS